MCFSLNEENVSNEFLSYCFGPKRLLTECNPVAGKGIKASQTAY